MTCERSDGSLIRVAYLMSDCRTARMFVSANRRDKQMQSHERAQLVGVVFAVIAAIAVAMQNWTAAVFGALMSVQWFLVMAARIVKEE